MHKVLSKSSRTWWKSKIWLNLPKFGWHLLQNSHLANVYTDPIAFSTSGKHYWSHSFEKCQRPPCDSRWMPDTVAKCRPFSFISILGIIQNQRQLGLVNRVSGEQKTMLLLAKNYDVFRDRSTGVLEQILQRLQILRKNFLANSNIDTNFVCKFLDSSVTIFLYKFSNFFHIFICFVGAWFTANLYIHFQNTY